MNSHNTSFLSFLSSSAFSTSIRLFARESFSSSSLFNLESRSREFLFSSQLSFIEISSDEESIIESSNDDEFESSQFTSRASLTSQFTSHASLTSQLTSRASLSSQFTSRAFNTSSVSFFELQRVSTQMKTAYIINEMRKIKLSFNDMFEKIMNSNSHKNMKSNLLNRLQSSEERNVLNIIIDECADIDQKHRAKFSSLTRHDLFRAWTFENMTNQRHVISKDIMKIIEKRASTLINHLRSVVVFKRIRLSDLVFQVIMKLISNDSSNLWINIFFMLCYIYRSRTCTRWSTLMSVQLHFLDIKRWIIEVLTKTKVYVEYKRILEVMKEIKQQQNKKIISWTRIENFVIVWNNFEQIMSVRDQRENNQKEFFFVTIAKIVETINYSFERFRQFMLRRNFKLEWFDILIHSENSRHHEHVKQIINLDRLECLFN